MTRIAPLSGQFTAAEQLRAEDIAGLKALGYRSVINNRPDGEGGGGYLGAAEAAARAEAAGLSYVHMPVDCFDVTDEETVEAFEALLARLPGPVLAYCRSGTRCAILWALAAARDSSVDEILESTAAAGFDLSVIEPELRERAEQIGSVSPVPAGGAHWPQQTLEDFRPAG